MTAAPERFACRNCRRPLHWVPDIGWLHGELPQYSGEPITCQTADPVCSPRPFTKASPDCEARLTADGPHSDCPCGCHRPAERSQR